MATGLVDKVVQRVPCGTRKVAIATGEGLAKRMPLGKRLGVLLLVDEAADILCMAENVVAQVRTDEIGVGDHAENIDRGVALGCKR